MIDRRRVTDSIAEIRESIRKLSSVARQSRTVFSTSVDSQAIAEHHLRRTLELMLEIGRRIISRQLPDRPSDYMEVFEHLGHLGALPVEYLEKNRSLFEFRNRFLRLDHDVTAEELHCLLVAKLSDLEQFCRHILAYLGEPA